jgi:ABC-type antimicrobial peptide transport system permease subunit
MRKIPTPIFRSFVVRASQPGTGALLARSLREAVYAVDPDQPVFNQRAVDDLLIDSVARRKFALILLGIFSGLALLLATIGLYAVMAYAAARRTSEFGLRLALGAQPGDVLRLVLRGGLRLTLLGIVLGSAGAITAGGLIASQLHDTAPGDPLVLSGIALLLGTVAMLACLIPARRATRVNPMVALRAE